MTENIGERLDRKSSRGGRPGDNPSTLGYTPQERPGPSMKHKPAPPSSIEETGLSTEFLTELALKQAFYLGSFTATDLADRMMLPANIVTALVQEMRQYKFCEVKGGTGYQSVTYSYTVSSEGRARAVELLEKNRYVGPAPVTLKSYAGMSGRQTIRNLYATESSIRQAFSPYVINEKLFKRLGAAVNSGKSLFIYGPPGNGKTIIAEALGTLMGEGVYIPYTVAVEHELIRVYDPVNHRPYENGKEAGHDRRWVLCKRPVVLVGGELTLKMLDLDFNEVHKFYEAPLQMKANGGVFIIDDFGRQMVRPRDLLNRWIVPLERRTDFLTLHTGKKFEIPFDQLVIFSTNIEPKKLMDEAFLRRIHYKIKIDHPTPGDFREIFRRVCVQKKLEYKDEAVDYLLNERYRKSGLKLNACHPRDIVEQVMDLSRYEGRKPELSREVLDEVWENYFVSPSGE